MLFLLEFWNITRIICYCFWALSKELFIFTLIKILQGQFIVFDRILRMKFVLLNLTKIKFYLSLEISEETFPYLIYMNENWQINSADIYKRSTIFVSSTIKEGFLLLVLLTRILKFGKLTSNKRFLI